MKRFWREETVVAAENGWAIALDGKPMRTPARAPLVVPTRVLADAIAAEWRAQTDEVHPQDMPLTGLANAAIDRAGPEIADMITAYGGHDLLCYRTTGPAELVRRQAAAWDPPLQWAGLRYDVAFTVTTGIAPVDQPPPTSARLRAAVGALDAFALAGLHPVVTVTGSLVLGLAVIERHLDAEAAWDAGEIDATYQAECWGDDPLAAAPRAARRAALIAGARLLSLIEGQPTPGA